MLFYVAELPSLGSVSQGSATNGAWRVGGANSRREPSQVRFWGGRSQPVPGPVWGRWEGQDLGSVISRNTEPFSVTNIRFQLPHPSLSLKNQEMGARHCLHSSRARSGSSHSTEPSLDWSEQRFLEVRDDGSARSGLLTKNRANQREGKGHRESTRGAFVLARGVALWNVPSRLPWPSSSSNTLHNPNHEGQESCQIFRQELRYLPHSS